MNEIFTTVYTYDSDTDSASIPFWVHFHDAQEEYNDLMSELEPFLVDATNILELSHRTIYSVKVPNEDYILLKIKYPMLIEHLEINEYADSMLLHTLPGRR